MPSIRIGFSTDFVLVNEQVGINTTNPTALLDARGQIRADRTTGSGGISTLTAYDGFLHSQQAIRNNISIAETTKGNLNSISGEIVIGAEVTVAAGTSIGGGRLDSLTVTSSFDLPTGGSANREVTPEKGSTRFNQDLGQLEFYTGYEWRTVSSYDGSSRGRGVFGGGLNSGSPTITTIDSINLSSGGSSTNFGVLTVGRRFCGGCSSSIRGIFGGGINPSPGTDNTIDYITIASSGNAIDFGDLSVSRGTTAASSSTRGLFFGGGNTSSNVIDYILINTLGNALDFGDMIAASDRSTSCSSPTRAINAGGTSTGLNTIEFVTISSTGNSVFFGNLTQKMGSMSGCSNTVRGIFAGGYNSPGGPFGNNTIEYITIASNGNSQDFGDLTFLTKGAASCSTSTRAVFAGGYSPTTSSYPTKIDFVNITSTGNAQNFGDLTLGRQQFGACSDSHGGLGGF